jgi:hypothetical protein
MLPEIYQWIQIQIKMLNELSPTVDTICLEYFIGILGKGKDNEREKG